MNPSMGTLFFNALTVTSTDALFRFAPQSGGMALYQAVDAISPFGGTASVAPGGNQISFDFLSGNGFAFQLNPGTSGYVQVSLTQVPVITAGSFTFAATLNGRGTVSGTFALTPTVVPEPSSMALVASGLALVGVAARRRRRR